MQFPLRIFKVAERSMEPVLCPGDYVLVSSLMMKISKGDMVLLKHPENGMTIVKRIYSVDKKKVRVEGDNKALSEDSRSFGDVGKEEIVGKVLVRF